jgi:hypothetical protein
MLGGVMKDNLSRGTFYFIGISLLIFASLPISVYSQEAKIRVIKNNAVLRLSPNSESLIIKELPAGALLNAEETIGEWVKVKLPPDKDGIVVTGYIHSSFVTFELKPTQSEPDIKSELKVRKSEAYIQWQNKLTHEKSTATTGLVTGLTGAATGLACGILAFTDKKQAKDSEGHWWQELKTGYLIGAGAGLMVFAFGMARNSNARNNIMQLENEGRIEGYITAGILPKYRAIGIQIELSF